MSKIISNIRKNSIFDALKMLIPMLMLNIGFVGFLYMTFCDGFNGEIFFLSCVFGLFAITSLIAFCKKIVLIINPFRSDVFKKFGSLKLIENIYQEIEQTIEYEDKEIIISSNYICKTNSLDILIAIEDVLAIHKFVHQTNFVVDYTSVVIVDKYGDEFSFSYEKEYENMCDTVLMILTRKCKNAEIGYTQDELDHIKRNKISLKNNLNTAATSYSAIFKNDNQKKQEYIIHNKHKKIVSLIFKYLGCLALGFVSSETLLMVLLGDSLDGIMALILVFIVTIPFFLLYHYLFISRKKAKTIPQQRQEVIQNTNPHTPPSISVSLNVCFCRKCGEKLLPDSFYCIKCGTKIVTEEKDSAMF